MKVFAIMPKRTRCLIKYLDFALFRNTYPPPPPPFRLEELGSFWAFSSLQESSSLDPWAPGSKEGGCQRISFENKVSSYYLKVLYSEMDPAEIWLFPLVVIKE